MCSTLNVGMQLKYTMFDLPGTAITVMCLLLGVSLSPKTALGSVDCFQKRYVAVLCRNQKIIVVCIEHIAVFEALYH